MSLWNRSQQARILPLSLAVALLLLCTSCGSSAQEESSDSETTAVVESQSPEPEVTTEPDPQPEEPEVQEVPEVAEEAEEASATAEVTVSSEPETPEAVEPEPSEAPVVSEPAESPVISEPEVEPEIETPSIEEPEVAEPAESVSTEVLPEEETLSEETVAEAQNYLDRLTFLGDSTTYGLKYYAMLSGGKQTTQVWTPSSGTLTLSNQSWASIVYPETGAEIPIREAAALANPEVLVITLGVNGVSFLTENGFKSEYRSLCSDILDLCPDTKIIANSMYPVESKYAHLDTINNTKISTANGWIAEVAAELGITYIDSYSLLLDDTGYMNPTYGNGDGIHLSPAGFTIILDNLASQPVL